MEINSEQIIHEEKTIQKIKYKKMIEHYEETVKSAEKHLELLETNKEKERNYETVTHTKEEINEKLEKAKKRIEELTGMTEEIKKNGEISITDPDAKHMSVSNNGTDIAHNVQVAVDSKNHLLVAIDAVSTPADQNQLYNMASKAVKELGLEKHKIDESGEEKDVITVIADKGYYCGEELEKCKNDHIKTIVPKQKSGSRTRDTKYIKDNFKYDKEKDIYICLNGKTLKNISKKESKEHTYKNTKACKNCI